MVAVKKIDLYVLRKFASLFVGAFCICLFVLMMQFMWRYIDELIGKGLTMDVLAKFFWYMSMTLVPMALPLSILLTALISFGNMGESLELTAMKSAGIPLLRIMRPLIVACGLTGVVSFYFQNVVSPKAQKQLTRMLVTMKETSPAIEIPEGVFYNGIPDVNLYVKSKDVKTGMLYDVIIYKMDQGFENAQIVVADSACLETTADKHFLKLTIYSGEQFENLRAQSSQLTTAIQVPYDRETFDEKTLLIDFDSGFELMNEGMFNGMARVKNLKELVRGADSIYHYCDSVGYEYYKSLDTKYLALPAVSRADSTKALLLGKRDNAGVRTTFDQLPPDRQLVAVQRAQTQVKNIMTDLDWEQPVTKQGYTNARRHWIEWHQKFTLSLACLIFFFIGAPLGAIIRKGGLGLPTVVSVIIFIFYYIINTSGMKLGKEGSIPVWLGMWMSTMVLAPCGAWITWRANNDSVVFNLSTFTARLRRWWGIRTSRNYYRKDVVISQPDYAVERERLQTLTAQCQVYLAEHHLLRLPNYKRLYFAPRPADAIADISRQMEEMLERLSNSRDARLLTIMNRYPELMTKAHLSPFAYRGTNFAIGVLVPVGILVAWRIWRCRIRLYRDLKLICKIDGEMTARINQILNHQS